MSTLVLEKPVLTATLVSRTKTLSRNTLAQGFSQWLTRVQTPTDARYSHSNTLFPSTSDCSNHQFFITTAPCDFLDGKHVVFGKVIDGMLTLRKIEHVQTGPNNRPKLVVKIVECGEM
jgi:hypothetical protein